MNKLKSKFVISDKSLKRQSLFCAVAVMIAMLFSVVGGCAHSDKEHKVDDANSVIEEAMISAGKSGSPSFQSQLFIMIFKALVRMGKIEAAKKAADMAFASARKNSQPYTRAGDLVAVTEALAQVGDTEAAKRAADEAFACVREEQNPGNQSNLLARAVKAMIVAGKIEEALTAARMIKEPITQSESFAAIAEAIGRLENKTHAKTVIDEGLAAARKNSDPYSRCYITARFGVALASIGKADDAKRVFDEVPIIAHKIENPHTQAWGLFSLFEALVKAEKLDEATMLLDEIYDLVRKVSIAYDFIAVAKAHAKFGRIDRAKRVLNEGVAALRKITDPGPQSNGMIELAEAMTNLGLKDDASKTVDEALATAHKINRSQVNRDGGYYFSIITGGIQVLAKIGKIDQALTTARELESPDSQISAFISIATAMSDAGRIEEAKRLIDDTLVLARKTKQPTYSDHPFFGYQSRMLTSLAEILVKIGKTKEARNVALEALVAARNIYNSEEQTPALIAVAEVLYKCSDAQAK